MSCPICDGVMCPQHPQWDEFADRLAAALAGPHAWATGDQKTIEVAIAHGCQHGTFSTTRAILATMGTDVEASLRFFVNHGVCCECCCEVVSHVEATVADPSHVCGDEAED